MVGGFFGGGDFEDIVDVDFEDIFEDGFISVYGRDGGESEFFERGVVFIVDMFILVDGELDGLLVVCNCCESFVIIS